VRYSSLFILLLVAFPLFSQDYLTSVRHYNAKDGLNARNIRFGFKDSQGFLWFTSISGAYRFDGYQFKSYKRRLNRDEPFAMGQLGEDSEKNIWFFHSIPTNGSADISILPFGKDSLVSFDYFFKEQTPVPSKDIYKVIFNDQNSIHIVSLDGQIFEYSNQEFSKTFLLPIAPSLFVTPIPINVVKGANDYHYITAGKEILKITPDHILEKRDTIPSLVYLDKNYFVYPFLFSQYDLTPELEELFRRENNLHLISSNSNLNSNYLLNWNNPSLYNFSLYDLEKNITIAIEPFGNPNTNISPHSFFVENENSIWLMAHDGVYHIKLNKKRFKNFLEGEGTREIIRNNDNLWVTSNTGLHQINLADKSIQTKTGKKWNGGRNLLLENNNRPYSEIICIPHLTLDL
jgi:hypothetical protein